jgi:hypothetical protein
LPEGIREVIGRGKGRRVERIDTPYSLDYLEKLSEKGESNALPLYSRSIGRAPNGPQESPRRGHGNYEQGNKNRETLIAQIDRRLKATP